MVCIKNAQVQVASDSIREGIGNGIKVTLGGGGMQGKKQNGDVLYKQLSS